MVCSSNGFPNWFKHPEWHQPPGCRFRWFVHDVMVDGSHDCDGSVVVHVMVDVMIGVFMM